MRNPLDLNNLPEDFARDHDKQPLNHSSLAAPGSYNKKQKNVGKDESRKVYECRFCSLKFCKSQALGGHMNRHRQERETETLNRARQLVFGNDSLYRLGNQPMVYGGYYHEAGYNNMDSTSYPTRLFSGTSTTVLPPASPAQHHKSESGKDYIMGHGCSTNKPFILQNMGCIATPPPEGSNNYTCIGAPVGQAFTLTGGSSGSQ